MLFAWRYLELNIICGDSFWDYFLVVGGHIDREIDIGTLFPISVFLEREVGQL